MRLELPVIQPGRVAEAQAPIFARIGIVGLGLIGGSIALAARQIWPSSLVIGVDNKDVLETAMRLHAIDVAADGLDHARPDLFKGRPWLFTPAGDAAGDALEKLLAFGGALGAVPRVTTAEAHDRLMAFLSHLPQLTASALMQVVGDGVGDQGLALAGRGLMDTTR